MTTKWQDKITEFCQKYNIPLVYLSDTLYEPKVVPMIRGKAFEFSTLIELQRILPTKDWLVEKVPMNAQIGFHDIDVKVTHKQTGKVIRVECKLAKKGGFRLFADGHSEIRVKCMRSRTLGPSKVAELSPKLGVDKKSLSIHNDQYLPADFDVVVTSIGNAFYRTDPETGMFEWEPNEDAIKFLARMNVPKDAKLKDFAFSKIFIAKTSSLAITSSSGVTCTRSKCRNKRSCGFIPNYPVIKFDDANNKLNNGWISLEDSLSVFESFLE